MEEIKVVYREIEISYREESERWSCIIDNGQWSEKQTLKECKKLIDQFLKKQVENTECIYIYVRGWRSEGFGSKRIITSIAENGDVWVKNENGGREKISANIVGEELALWNDANLKIVEEYKKQLRVLAEEDQKAKDILKKLVRFKNK